MHSLLLLKGSKGGKISLAQLIQLFTLIPMHLVSQCKMHCALCIGQKRPKNSTRGVRQASEEQQEPLHEGGGMLVEVEWRVL